MYLFTVSIFDDDDDDDDDDGKVLMGNGHHG